MLLFLLLCAPLLAACVAAATGEGAYVLPAGVIDRAAPAWLYPASTPAAGALLTAAPLAPSTAAGDVLGAPQAWAPLPRYAVGVTTRTLVMDGKSGPMELETVIWYPAAGAGTGTGIGTDESAPPVLPDAPPADGPFPVLLFSHGADSSPTQSTFLTVHLAAHGFVVAAPPHPGSTIADCLGCGDEERMRALLLASAARRPRELAIVLDALDTMSHDPTSPFFGRLDVARAAAIGHSWGGHTALMSAAREPRLQAAVALAPVVNDELLAVAPALTRPVLVMGGRLDAITPFARAEELFAALPHALERALIGFAHGGHNAFAQTCPTEAPGCRPGELGAAAHALVNRYVLAFLRAHLLGDAEAGAVFRDRAGDAEIEITLRP